MKHTLKYFIKIALMLTLFVGHAQETTSKKPIPPASRGVLPEKAESATPKARPINAIDTLTTTPKIDRYGLRVGLDLYKISRGFYDKNYKGLELVADYRYNKKYFIAAEIGTENKTTDDDRLNFTTKGSYLKAGFDYNAYENWLDMENIISIGLRYGFSTFNQNLNSYRTYNTSQYFGENETIITDRSYNGLTASWAEVVAGLKAKVFDNVFVGFSLRLNTLISNKKPADFDNLYIPGFNRTYNGSFGVGFNYTVTYFVPLYKKKVVPVKKK
ncbi:hypothetical protein FFWV33_10330 [Flavobacterium faecale]|uniref:Outer membrane protein beta-barrel domain-containing protein n=1 Tax=Flavobacterium faecale TaxID=1355330 RepID=A0A2S1LDU9_9FLAO|nr:DUF6048 family protein [Flavobacterium faecale]AWG21897.1 hypothetical protein FFWV33_10330 [Flavobacterium faecale]